MKNLLDLIKNYLNKPLLYYVPLSNVKTLHIMLGASCNHRCKMCFQTDYSSKLSPIIYKKKLKVIYPYLRNIILQGGEPTVLPSTREFIDIVRNVNPNIKFSMMTNGHLFDRYWRDVFLENGDFVNFSINAASKKIYESITVGGDWEMVINNLKTLVNERNQKKSNLKIYASFVIFEDNISELSDFVRLCDKIGVDLVRFFYDVKRFPKNKSFVENELKKVRNLLKELKIKESGLLNFETVFFKKNLRLSKKANCVSPFTNLLVVNIDGGVNFCCLSSYSVGNLNRSSIQELFNNRRAIKFRKMISKKNYSICSPSSCSLVQNLRFKNI